MQNLRREDAFMKCKEGPDVLVNPSRLCKLKSLIERYRFVRYKFILVNQTRKANLSFMTKEVLKMHTYINLMIQINKKLNMKLYE